MRDIKILIYIVAFFMCMIFLYINKKIGSKLIISTENWIRINLQLIAHGRKICKARKPKCEICFLNKLCLWSKENKKCGI